MTAPRVFVPGDAHRRDETDADGAGTRLGAMPRIPRRWKGGEQGPSPSDPTTSPTIDEQPTSVLPAPATSGHAIATSPSGEPVAAGEPEAATAEAGAVALPPQEGEAVPIEEHAPPDAAPGFRQRARMRRRLRYLRRRRELAFRDLGGLVFDLHRFGSERGDLVVGKLEGLGAIDAELRTLEGALRDRRELTELREPGIAACRHCQALHDPDANFCPICGTPLRGAAPAGDASAGAVAEHAPAEQPAAEQAPAPPPAPDQPQPEQPERTTATPS